MRHEVNRISILVAQENENEIFSKINSGKWLEILESDDFKSFLATGTESFDKDYKLGVAVACLMAFTQDNFTGPDLFESSNNFRFQTFEGNNDERWKVDSISVDGIELNANIRHIALLITSRNFLEDLHSQFPSDLVS